MSGFGDDTHGWEDLSKKQRPLRTDLKTYKISKLYFRILSGGRISSSHVGNLSNPLKYQVKPKSGRLAILPIIPSTNVLSLEGVRGSEDPMPLGDTEIPTLAHRLT